MSSDQSKLTKAELAEAIGEQFRISQNRSDVFDEVAEELLGLNHTDQRCLDIITRRRAPLAAPSTAGDRRHREAGLTTGGVTAVVDRLERDGWARRVRDTDDRRRVLIEAAPEVMEKTWEIWGPLKAAWDAEARGYTREQLEFLLRFLERGNEIAAAHIERIREMRDSK